MKKLFLLLFLIPALLWGQDVTMSSDQDAFLITANDAAALVELTHDTATESFTNKTLDDASNVIHADALHEDMRNESGATMNIGDAVYISGYSVGQERALVSLADSDAGATMPSVAILAETSLANNATGSFIQDGTLDSVKTDTWSVGDDLYISGTGTTGNTLTSTKPTGTGLIQKVATVLRSHATMGVIEIFGAGRVNDIPNLAATNLWVGNGSGVAIAVVLSSDVTMDNAGAVTIGAIGTSVVTTAGALMDSEVDANIKTLTLLADTNISAFGATIINDADEAAFKVTTNLQDTGAYIPFATSRDILQTDMEDILVSDTTGTANVITVVTGMVGIATRPPQFSVWIEDGTDSTTIAAGGGITLAGTLVVPAGISHKMIWVVEEETANNWRVWFNDPIVGTDIGNDEIDSQHYVAASVDNEHLADNAVDSDEIAAGAIDYSHLGVSAKFRQLAIADLNDTTTPHVLTVEETTNTFISNYRTTGADAVFTFPAAHIHANFGFGIGDEFQEDLEPPSGTAFRHNGTLMATDEHIVNSADTLGEKIFFTVLNENGTLVYQSETKYANFVEATP